MPVMSLRDGYTELPPQKIAAVVTYLQMTAPPTIPPVAADPQWALKPHVRPDPEWYRRLFRAVGEDWLWFSRLQMDDAELKAIIQDPAVDVFALEIGGAESGILELDRREVPDIELAFIGLVSPAIGRGAGRFLLDQAIRIAWSHQPRRLLVHTCTLDHPRALNLYRAAGFVPYKRAIEIADDPRLSGTARRDAAPHVPLL
jgi:GNAT superfamily N-acetyltransferase